MSITETVQQRTRKPRREARTTRPGQRTSLQHLGRIGRTN